MNTKLEGRLLGYCRVSSNDQQPELQYDALLKAGVTKKLIFSDKVSGAKAARPGLDSCLAELKPGDVLVTWRLDRLGRSLRHLLNLIDDLKQRGIGFKSLQDGFIDTTSANGELIFHIFMALAQFERRLIQERTRAGLASARARGRKGGRPPMSTNDPRINTAKRLHADKAMPIVDICRTLQISRPTLYRWLATKPAVPQAKVV